MSDKTILEIPEQVDSNMTVLDQNINTSPSISLTTFRGSKIVEEFEAIGAEADVYLIEKDYKQYFLKLYRRGIKLNNDVLKTIQELSHNHKFFAELYEYGFDESVGRYYELSEYIQHGSLDNATIDSSNVNTLIASLNESLSLLHENQIIHRDLKPNNILLRSVDPFNIVLVDFGVSSVIADDMTKVLTTLKGTYAYTAPEVMSGYIGKEVDYFSLGMILLELLDKNPLIGLDGAVVLHTLASTNVDIPNHIDNRLKLLLQGLLTRDPKKRWGYRQVNEWIKNKSPVVHFDTYVGKVDNSKKYKFKDAYYTQKELAKVFIRQENFEDALKHIGRGYITKFLEKLEENDEAIKLDEEFRAPIEKLIYFIYSQEKDLPFSLYGVVIDEDYMFSLLLKYTREEMGKFDAEIFKLFESGKLKQLINIYETHSENVFSSKKYILNLPKDEYQIYDYFDINNALSSLNMDRLQRLVKNIKDIDQDLLSDVLDTENGKIIELFLSKTKNINSENSKKLLFSNNTKFLDKKHIDTIKNKNEIILELIEKNKINTIKTFFDKYDLAKMMYEQIDRSLNTLNSDDLIMGFCDDFEIDVDIKIKNNQSLLDLAIEKEDVDLVEYLSQLSNNTIHNGLIDFIIKHDSLELFKKYEPFDRDSNEILYQSVQDKRNNISTYLIDQVDTYENKLFLLAINTDQLNIIKQLISRGFIFDQNSDEQRYFLLSAFTYNRQDIANFIIVEGANVNIKDDKGNTLLHLTLQKDWSILLQNLLNVMHVDLINSKNENGQTAFDIAIFNKDIESIELLSKYAILPKLDSDFWDIIIGNDSVDLYKKYENIDHDKNEILYQSIKSKHEKIALYLIEKQNNFHSKLLFLAIATDQLDILKSLTNKGVDLESKGKYGDSPILYAFQKKRIAIVKFLIEQKVNLTNKDKFGNTLLILAIQNDWDTLAKILIASGHIDINENNHVDNTALFYAVKKNNYAIASFLLTKGADVTVTNKQGETPLHFYLKQSKVFSTSTVKELLEHGMNLYDQDKSGRTVQDLATKNVKKYLDIFDTIKKNDMERIKLLINAGTSVDQKSKDDKTPLILALKHKNEDMVEFLIERGANKNYAFHWLVNEVAYTKGAK